MPDGAAPSVTLSPRLQTVADAVPVCDTVADIGSDHGYVTCSKKSGRVTLSSAIYGKARWQRRGKIFAERNAARRLIFVWAAAWKFYRLTRRTVLFWREWAVR